MDPLTRLILTGVRGTILSSSRPLDVGLVFQVGGALGIAVREFWHGVPLRSGISFLVPGECVWPLAYPLVVPNSPRKISIPPVAQSQSIPERSSNIRSKGGC
jgi:hypothetical protein